LILNRRKLAAVQITGFCAPRDIAPVVHGKRFQFQDPGHCNLGRSRLFTRFGRGPRCIQAGYANQLTLINRRMSATPYGEVVD